MKRPDAAIAQLHKIGVGSSRSMMLLTEEARAILAYIAELENDRRRLIKLSDAQTEYIDLLGKSEGMTAGFLHAHNWRWPDSLIEGGKRLREAIAAAQREVSHEPA